MEFESVEEVLEFLLDININHQGNEMRVATVNPDGTRSDFKKAIWKTIKNLTEKQYMHFATCLGWRKFI